MSNFNFPFSSSTSPSTASFPQTCENCTKSSSSTANMGNQGNPDLWFSVIGRITDLEKKVSGLEEESKRSSTFYTSSTKLSDTVRAVVIILLLIPIFQLIACACIVYHLGIQEELPNLLYWVLSGVTIFSLIEIVGGGVTLSSFSKRLDALEKNMDK